MPMTETDNPNPAPHDSTGARETRQVWEYLGRPAQGIFVDVGANEPFEHNMTWFLEAQGWTGVLVEPNPELAAQLRELRPRSKTFQVAVGSPAQVGEIELHLTVGTGGQSSPIPDYDAPLTGKTVRVKLQTLDTILTEAGVTQIDFLSLDVEEMELEVLAGFDFEKWQPKLILIEDFLYDGRKHACLRAHGYKLIHRTGYNNWYVPRASRDSLFTVSSPGEIINLARKMWISGPLIGARRKWRRRRAQKLSRSN